MRCREHSREASHACLHRDCAVKLLCDACRLDHKNHHPTNAEEHPLSKVLEKCRHKLAGEVKQLEGAFHQFEVQEAALRSIQRCKQQLDEHMETALDRVRLFYCELKAKLDLQNADLQYLVERERELLQVNGLKRRILSMIYSLNSAEEIREALSFSSSEVYQRLRSFNIKNIDKYWVYAQGFVPSVQISAPQLISQTVAKSGSTYMPKPIPNDSQQHFIITEPEQPALEADAAFFFDTESSALKLYNIKLNAWETYPSTVGELLEHGEAVYEPASRRYYYLGGSTVHAKAKAVICFDNANKQWSKLPPLLKARSSFGSCFMQTPDGPKIVVAGGLDDTNTPIKDCELYDPNGGGSVQIRPLNFAASNQCLCAFGRNTAYKFGGLANGVGRQQVCPTIERYNTIHGGWVFLNPDIFFPEDLGESYRLFHANSRAIQINSSEIFVFGGYRTDNRGTTESYILNIEEPVKGVRKNTKHTIRFWNQKPLPKSEGFSRTQPCISQKHIYALQDIAQSERQFLAGERTILRFDGYQWSVIEKVYS